MTTEDLMKKRYKVIADYPYSIFKVGEVLSSFDQFSYISESDCRKYPHLFKPLEWWEDRKPEDLPEYVKNIWHKTYHKVEKWDTLEFIIDGRVKKHFDNYKPATKEEFEEYESQK